MPVGDERILFLIPALATKTLPVARPCRSWVQQRWWATSLPWRSTIFIVIQRFEPNMPCVGSICSNSLASHEGSRLSELQPQSGCEWGCCGGLISGNVRMAFKAGHKMHGTSAMLKIQQSHRDKALPTCLPAGCQGGTGAGAHCMEGSLSGCSPAA